VVEASLIADGWLAGWLDLLRDGSSLVLEIDDVNC